jgi:prepilin-type N-terminal cleavage/methylation domain-containing protein
MNTITADKRDSGITLLELLVVLMILSIVLTAAVRTWDVTLERGRAQTTSQKLSQLVKVIIGDPDYIVAGQRADFGFVGDEGRLPEDLQELVVRPDNDTIWRGPYVHPTFNQSTDGYRIDGWGDTIIYGWKVYHKPESLWVRSYGGRGVADRSRWQTLYFPYAASALTQSTVTGQVVDIRGKEATGTQADNLIVTLYYPRDGHIDAFEVLRSGSFSYPGIPQGTHRITAKLKYTASDSVVATKDVPVYPGVGADVTLRLPREWP